VNCELPRPPLHSASQERPAYRTRVLVCQAFLPDAIKQSYWREPDTGRAGNTIYFFVSVLGMTFHQATEAVTR